MKNFKFPLLTIILLIGYSLNAQEWSSRIAIVEEHLIAYPLIEEDVNPSTKNLYNVAFLQDGGDVFAISDKTFSTGINVMFEEVLESGFFVKDMLVYSIGMSYDIGRFGLSFSFENFLNAGQQESGILPIPEYVGKDVINAMTHELDSPYALAIGITYSF